MEVINNWSNINRVEAIITTIIDQRFYGHDFEKQYYIFIKGYGKDKNKYLEIEADINFYGGYDDIKFYNVGYSSHGSPASYGKEIYSSDSFRKNIKYTEEITKNIL